MKRKEIRLTCNGILMGAFLLILSILFLTGCKTEIGNRLVDHRKAYCSRTSDSLVKKVAIKAIQSKLPGYPEEGICTELGLTHMTAADNLTDAEIMEEVDKRGLAGDGRTNIDYTR